MRVQQSTLRFGFGGGLTPVVRNLLIANGVVWVAQLFAMDFLVEHFALNPLHIIEEFKFWQLITYMFLHGGFFHLFFNMFALWMFGTEVERVLGSSDFLKYYMFTGIGGGMFQLLMNWGSPIPILGASAAIYGILVAFAVLFPNRVVTLLLFFVLPVQLKAKTLALIFVGISLILGIQSQLLGSVDMVAHFAHLGGAMVGFFLLRGRYYSQRAVQRISEMQEQRRQNLERQKRDRINRKRKEIDEILDRINEVGYDNISPEEREFLKKASEYLSKEDDM